LDFCVVFREKCDGAGPTWAESCVMLAHNPLLAKLVEEAGFDGIWVSKFELLASQALPDVSLVEKKRHLWVKRNMAKRVLIPMVADIDFGSSNAINVPHAVERFECAAAVVTEGKTFPKITSLIADGRQELLIIEEF
jgi:phosphoenolpyruvate phosphomutase